MDVYNWHAHLYRTEAGNERNQSRVDRLTFRNAQRADLPVIIGLLADDALGGTREASLDPLPPACISAFEEIERDPRNELAVAEDAGAVVGVLQLTTDKRRPDAHRFYASLGFVASHEGMKPRL